MTTPPPPGWYPDGQGNTRYWNGAGWVDPPGGPARTPAPRKRKKWPWVVAGIAVVIVVASVAAAGSSDDKHKTAVISGPTGSVTTSAATIGSSTPATKASTSTAPRAGSVIDVETFDGAKASVSVSNLSRATPSILFSGDPATLIGVTVTITGKGGTLDVNPLYFSARTKSGDTYDVALGDYDKQLDTTTVTAGQKVRGVVAFKVTGEPIATIIMEDSGFGQLAEWKVR